MDIYIDESGPFLPLNAQRERISVVAAVVLPTRDHDEILGRFVALRESWPGAIGERKASQLSEQHFAELFGLLSDYDVVVEACALDMGSQHRCDVDAFSRSQAEKLRQSVTPSHHPNMIREMNALAEAWERQPPQLVAQLCGLVTVIESVLRISLPYYAQRIPEELGRFAWNVDAKDRTETPYEELWKKLVAPFLQSRFAREPAGLIAGLDYSHYRVFDSEITSVPAWYGPPGPLGPGESFSDLRKVLRHIALRQSEDAPGIQLADIAANVLARAFNRKLTAKGWEGLGRLFVRRTPQVVKTILLDDRTDIRRIEKTNYHGHVLERLDASAKSMWTREGLALAQAAEKNRAT